MPALQFTDWLNLHGTATGHWYVKRLSGNDTQATGSHQAGPYIPNRDAFRIFTELHRPDELNPRVAFKAIADSHDHTADANIIWYNNRLHGSSGTRNETRITNLGGSASPLLDPENTGAIALFFFTGNQGERECRYWVCRDEQEEDLAEAFAGPVEPGQPLFWNATCEQVADAVVGPEHAACWLETDQLPEHWFEQFPTPQEVFDTALGLQSYQGLPTDDRMVRRRDCEYSVFQSIEYAVETGAIEQGFNSIHAFLAKAQTILQRRKSRSGRSLELQLRTIFAEESITYAFQPTTESGNRPDFIFPSQSAYDNPHHPAERLRMLAAKTTVKERWRQILNEAHRIPVKHLFTLQEGVSEPQFAQMRDAGVRLVVPRSLHTRYPQSVRGELITLQDFVNETRAIA